MMSDTPFVVGEADASLAERLDKEITPSMPPSPATMTAAC